MLRFRFRSTEEAKALASAIRTLFLDVWEFSNDWVDIRLSKDVVCCPFSIFTLNRVLSTPFPRYHPCSVYFHRRFKRPTRR